MSGHDTNELGQPIGLPVSGEFPRPTPPYTPMEGQYCSVVPLDVNRHTPGLYRAFANDADGHNWTYLPYGPFDREQDFEDWTRATCMDADPMFHTVLDEDETPTGMASFLRIEPAAGVIEVGHIHFSPLLQRSPKSTETMYLMMRRVFDELGYRRYEWKCDALNAASCRSAERLGFTFEGIFRQATHYKGRNRDTAWYSILDSEWSRIKAAFEAWLSPDNFDQTGQQRQPLQARSHSKGSLGHPEFHRHVDRN
ncbi:GNAT family N-acetyltransferase [Ruegeria atlantica]|uniref:GNAT family N-acetyltransferase n=1 Tax=Ruegeria atlantica TaxID=81569 RepID=UPI00147ACC35|nr:GNAT family protein [Ruegeria atlantica]